MGAVSTIFNGPLEVGIRILTLLSASFPLGLNLNQLVLLDYGLLHSADFDGPESLHPALPVRVGELGLKRALIEDGLLLLLRSSLADVQTEDDGLTYRATEEADGFLGILSTDYAAALMDRAAWITAEVGHLDETALRDFMRRVTSSWSEEFHDLGAPGRTS